MRGFSLVELSIVLVILGLLTGGILTGQSLIKAAELRAVSTEYQQFQSATNTFRDKYFAIPGDMRNATNFWGTFSSGSCPTGSGVGTETCDGNGDGVIDDSAAANQVGEEFLFWQHLANAGLIEGSYSGISGPDSLGDAEIGTNVPRSKFSLGGWSALNLSNFAGNAVAFEFDYGNHFRIGATNTTGATGQPLLTPEEAWNVDTKLDDGRPGSGKVIAANWDDGCSAADDGGSAFDDLNASYRLTDTSVQCPLFFVKAF